VCIAAAIGDRQLCGGETRTIKGKTVLIAGGAKNLGGLIARDLSPWLGWCGRESSPRKKAL